MSDHTVQTPFQAALENRRKRRLVLQQRQVAASFNLHWLRALPVGALLPILVIAVILVGAAAPGWVAPYAPGDMDDNAILAGPSIHHLFGTDQFGSDILTSVIYGARQSVMMAFGAILLGASSGMLIGLVSGYWGGKIDAGFMRLIDIWMSIPSMLLALIVAAALGGGFASTIIAVASMIIPRFSRIIRAQVIAIKTKPFVTAARTLGASHLWILRRHILPHTASLFLVLATLGVGDAILTGSALSFIGVGVSANQPDWGYLLSEGRDYLTDAWWYATFPGFAITALVIAVNLLGDILHNKLNPQHKLR